jgi:hypothetical protein
MCTAALARMTPFGYRSDTPRTSDWHQKKRRPMSCCWWRRPEEPPSSMPRPAASRATRSLCNASRALPKCISSLPPVRHVASCLSLRYCVIDVQVWCLRSRILCRSNTSTRNGPMERRVFARFDDRRADIGARNRRHVRTSNVSQNCLTVAQRY